MRGPKLAHLHKKITIFVDKYRTLSAWDIISEKWSKFELLFSWFKSSLRYDAVALKQFSYMVLNSVELFLRWKVYFCLKQFMFYNSVSILLYQAQDNMYITIFRRTKSFQDCLHQYYMPTFLYYYSSER